MSQETNLQAIADAIRAKEGSTDPIPANTFADRIAAIQTGVQLPTLTNPGAAADILAGKQLIDQDGNPLTGTMPEVEQATPTITVSSTGLITAQATQAAGFVAGGTKSATQQLPTQVYTTDFIKSCSFTPGSTNSRGVLRIDLKQSVSDVLCAHFMLTAPSDYVSIMIISICKYDSRYYVFGNQVSTFMWSEATFCGSYFTVQALNSLFTNLSSETSPTGAPYEHCIYIP